MNSKVEIILESNSGIAQADTLRIHLDELYRSGSDVVIDGTAVNRIDTAILQLLGSFFTAMDHSGFTVSWKQPSDVLVQSAGTLGLKSVLKL